MKNSENSENIQNLIKQVLNAKPNSFRHPQGQADNSTCPFCNASVPFVNARISQISHLTDCAYNIAKTLID